MTDEQLQQRANIYARQAVINHRVAKGLNPMLVDPASIEEAVTLIARAFVIGYAAGLEDSARLARGVRVRK